MNSGSSLGSPQQPRRSNDRVTPGAIAKWLAGSTSIAEIPLPSSHVFMTMREFGKCIRRSKAWCYKKAKTGELPAVKLEGIGLRISVSSATQFIDQLIKEGKA